MSERAEILRDVASLAYEREERISREATAARLVDLDRCGYLLGQAKGLREFAQELERRAESEA
jgi:hypothetical protein